MFILVYLELLQCFIGRELEVLFQKKVVVYHFLSFILDKTAWIKINTLNSYIPLLQNVSGLKRGLLLQQKLSRPPSTVPVGMGPRHVHTGRESRNSSWIIHGQESRCHTVCTCLRLWSKLPGCSLEHKYTHFSYEHCVITLCELQVLFHCGLIMVSPHRTMRIIIHIFS